MKLDRAKEVIDKLKVKIDEIKEEQSKFSFTSIQLDNTSEFDSTKYLNSDEYKHYLYLEGKVDLLRQLSETVLYDSCFEEVGDLAYIKDTYKNNYQNFLDGYIDSFIELTNL